MMKNCNYKLIYIIFFIFWKCACFRSHDNHLWAGAFRCIQSDMVRAWHFANVAACHAVSNPAWCRMFMFIPSQSWDIVSRLCPSVRHFTLKCFTWLGWKWVPGRTETATVCSPWSWSGTWINRPNDQGLKCKVGWCHKIDIRLQTYTFTFFLSYITYHNNRPIHLNVYELNNRRNRTCLKKNQTKTSHLVNVF